MNTAQKKKAGKCGRKFKELGRQSERVQHICNPAFLQKRILVTNIQRDNV